jgi:Flp pilus assembly protein TadD
MPVHAGSIAKLRDILRGTPVAIPALGALALFVIWAGSDAGYPVTHWAPGGVILLALLAITLSAAPLRLREVPVPVRVAVACLALFTVLSYLSILWAQMPGDAWEGANRTLVYLLVFAMFALWPQRGVSAALLLGAWTLAMVALAVFVVLHVDSSAHPAALFSEGRLKYPADYENACAAVWCMALWPALLLSASGRLHWALRGLLGGGTVLLGDLALLSQSRGSLYATVVMLILVFALLPGRVRTFLVLVPVVAGIGLSTPTVLHVGDRALHGGGVRAALHSATAAIFIAALLVGAIVALGAAIESRRAISEASAARLRRAVGAIAVATLVAVLAGGWVAAGDPVARVRHGWDTFKGGYAADNAKVNRLVSGLGSGRYDFYRVALDEFLAHPIGGIGADNFAQQYLARGHAEESPHYPHSVELRTLAQTGIVGVLLAVVGLGAALLAGGRVALSSIRRRADPLGATVAAAALAGFAYWVVHGTFDWFWEFAGLAAPAFALLGLACALAPRRITTRPEDARQGVSEGDIPDEGEMAAEPRDEGERAAAAGGEREAVTAARAEPRTAGLTALRRVALAAGVVLALAATLSLVTPWLSQLQVQKAARIWPTAPRRAYSALNDAARLNPLGDEPYLLAGSIALRFGDLARADHEFSLALDRVPGDAYATLERGAIASARGDRSDALRLLERTARLSPHDELIGEVLKFVREGRRVSIEELNRSILLKARKLA